jgi:hypothetical protein
LAEPDLPAALLIAAPLLSSGMAVLSFERGQGRLSLLFILITAGLGVGFGFALAVECEESFSERCDYTRETDSWLIPASCAPFLAMVLLANDRRIWGYAALAAAPLAWVIFSIGYLGESAVI